MERQPLIALLGDSVLMDGVAVGLGNRQTLGVVRVELAGNDIEESLGSLRPDLVVFELDSLLSASVLSLLKMPSSRTFPAAEFLVRIRPNTHGEPPSQTTGLSAEIPEESKRPRLSTNNRPLFAILGSRSRTRSKSST